MAATFNKQTIRYSTKHEEIKYEQLNFYNEFDYDMLSIV